MTQHTKQEQRQALLTVDLGFGDAGKGSIVDYLVRAHDAHTVIRFNGGAQAGHRVVVQLDDGSTREHVFSQFGSGTLAGAATHLSRFLLLDPLAMLAEAEHLRQLVTTTVDGSSKRTALDPFAQTTVDGRALVVTPYHQAINRLREVARGDARHGSCGMGIGETMVDWLAHGEQVLFAEDLLQIDQLRTKLAFLRKINQAKLDTFKATLPHCQVVVDEVALLYEDEAWLLAAYADFIQVAQIVPASYNTALLQHPGTVVFEAAQGVLLDEWRGFHPYTTWSTTTLANADQLLCEAGYVGEIKRIGITRAYSTRHGAGPFVTEDAALSAQLPDACNGHGPWQQHFRVGWLDLVLLRYALAVVGKLDYLAVTCLDRLQDVVSPRLCTGYSAPDGRTITELGPASQPQDLAHQSKLTALLATCRPQLAPISDVAELPAILAERLGIPIGISSYGPTAEDKVEIGQKRNIVYVAQRNAL